MIFTRQYSSLLLLAAMAAPVFAQSYDDLGCFTDDTGTLGSVHLYQTSGYCADNCTNSNYFYIRGTSCYCTNKKPTSKANDCNTPCPGFGTVMCGGPDSYSYWTNLLYMGDTDLGGSSSSSSSSATSSSSSSSLRSTTTSSQITTSSSILKTSSSLTTASSTSSDPSTSTFTTSTETASVPTTSTSQSQVIVTVSGKETVFVTASDSSSTATTADASQTSGVLDASMQQKNSSGGVSGGAIAGIVIGVVAGLAVLIMLLIFMWRRHAARGDNHDNYTGGGKSPTTFSDPFGVMVEDKASFGLSPPHNNTNNLPSRMNSTSNGGSLNGGDNNFMAVDQRLNPVMLGDRRFSEGSIADERDYSRKILRVANPDA